MGSGLCGEGLFQTGEEFIGLDTFGFRDERLVAKDGIFGKVEFSGHGKNEPKVEIGIWEVRFEDGTDFVVKPGEAEVALIEIEVSEVVVRFEVARVVDERKGKAIERFGEFARFGFDDAKVAVGFGHAIPSLYGKVIGLLRFLVVVLVEKEGLFEWRQLSRQIKDLPERLTEQVELSVPFEIVLLSRRPDTLVT